MNDQGALNTDRHLFTDEKGNSCHMTAGGGLGINAGGSVAVLPLDQWFACMREVFPKPDWKAPAERAEAAAKKVLDDAKVDPEQLRKPMTI